MTASLQAQWFGKLVIRERLYIFRLVSIAIKDWGETNQLTAIPQATLVAMPL